MADASGGLPPRGENDEGANRKGAPIAIATLLWAPNESTLHYSNMYDEGWVEKLYRGFARNLTRPFRFVCFVDRIREFAEPIEQELIEGAPSYASCIQPYRLNVPMILVGLDTIVTGNCDELADFCFYSDRIAVPRDPFYPDKLCDGVHLAPAGMKAMMYDAHAGENDMEWVRSHTERLAVIDKELPGQVNSYKGFVERNGLLDTRICYFHGERKPHELGHVGWVERHWV